MGRRTSDGMLRQAGIKLPLPRWRPVGMSINRRIFGRIGEPEIRREVDGVHFAALLFRQVERLGQQRCRSPMRRRRKKTNPRRPPEKLRQRRPTCQHELRVDPGQVWENARHPATGLAFGNHRCRQEMGMEGQQPQQLPGHITRSAQNGDRNRRLQLVCDRSSHQLRGAERSGRFSLSITTCASASGEVRALIAGTFMRSSMMVVPTALSVAGPVIATASMP